MNHLTAHLTEEDLVLIYYNEPSANSAHLSECPACRHEYEALKRTLDVCAAVEPPEADPEFLRRLAADKPRRLVVMPARTQRLAWYAAAATVVLSVAFYAGRASRPPEPAVLSGLSEQARERILAITLADHLDRAELLLTEISNSSDSAAPADRIRDLVSEGRLLRTSITGGSGELLDEVERFMLDVANAPEQMEQWRARINSGSLLFKVRILQSNLRQKEEKL